MCTSEEARLCVSILSGAVAWHASWKGRGTRHPSYLPMTATSLPAHRVANLPALLVRLGAVSAALVGLVMF